MGARVVAAASSAEKLALAREHGADEGVQYPLGDPWIRARRARSPIASRRRAARTARRSSTTPWAGTTPRRRCVRSAIRAGTWWSGFPPAFRNCRSICRCSRAARSSACSGAISPPAIPALHAANVAALMALYGEGRIKPAVTERFPLARGAEAIARLGTRGARQDRGDVVAEAVVAGGQEVVAEKPAAGAAGCHKSMGNSAWT